MRSLFLLCIAMLSFCPLSFSTNVSGGIYNNTTWTLANSPYVVTGNIVVFDEYTLTIEPGVEVLLTGDYKIEVRGKLRAIGTATENITIKPETPTTTKWFWQGFVFIGTTFAFHDQCIMEYCNISNARYCVDLDIAYHGPYIFRHCTFSDNYNINDDGGAGGTYFEDCKILNNDYGINGFQFNGKVSNCYFDNNKYWGLSGADSVVNCTFVNHPDVALMPYGYTANCEIHDNNIGVISPFNSVNHTFINNKVSNNTIGMKITSCFNDQNSDGNEICDNTQYNIVLSTSNNCSIPNNCWCSTDETYIRSKILDGYTDITKGLVTFTPFSTDCSSAGLSPQNVPNLNSGNIIEMEVYPNPTPGNSFKIKSQEPISASNCSLHDITGKKVDIRIMDKGSKEYEVTATACRPGVYFLYIKKPMNKRTIQKVILE